jgi:hypothetical protein
MASTPDLFGDDTALWKDSVPEQTHGQELHTSALALVRLSRQAGMKELVSSALRLSALTLVLMGSHGLVLAQQQPSSSGLYTCKDAQGRTLTSDRPIPECLDREQRELRSTGGTLRRIEPTYTALELADREERERNSQLSAARRTEEQRRERALLVRYPNPAAHERESAEALASLDAILRVARQHLRDLANDRDKIENELEFYKGNPSRAPEALRLRTEDNRRRVEAQGRFIAAHESEKERLRERFMEERSRLTPLWSPAAARSQT